MDSFQVCHHNLYCHFLRLLTFRLNHIFAFFISYLVHFKALSSVLYNCRCFNCSNCCHLCCCFMHFLFSCLCWYSRNCCYFSNIVVFVDDDVDIFQVSVLTVKFFIFFFCCCNNLRIFILSLSKFILK